MSSLSAQITTTNGRPSPISPSRTATPNSQDPTKRKKPTSSAPPAATVWAQSAENGDAHEVATNVTYAIDHLREKEGQAVSAEDLIGFLNVFNPDVTRQLRTIFKRHSKIEYDAQGLDGKGSYRYRPPLGVTSADQLLAFLQSQTTAQGIRVSQLKDGWSGALDTIETLEKEGKLLVTRNKKDNSPKMVWPNDPTLIHEVDNDFKNLWHDVQAPGSAEALRNELLAFGLTPTSQVKKVMTGPGEGKKKKKMPRSGGKTTNTHMAHVLKDYSHLRRG
ncbi:MAG: hypothetical protein Q9162_002041 [Coniocarpon cinnabarinum]